MKLASIICIFAVVACNRSPRDPIDSLMEELPNQIVPSYLFVPIKLPASASADSLLNELASRGTFSEEGISNYTIMQTRFVPDPRDAAHGEHYTAALINTDKGRKI